MEILIAAANQLSDDELMTAIKLIGGSDELAKAERMTRAALIEVYEMRNGSAAAETLMDELGM